MRAFKIFTSLVFGFLILSAMLVGLGSVTAAANGQTLQEVLEAIQKRDTLVQERENARIDLENSLVDYPNPTQKLLDIKKIQWPIVGSDLSNVDSLESSDKLALLQRAWLETSRLEKYFFEPRYIETGSGLLSQVHYEERVPLMEPSNYGWALQTIARRLANLTLLEWPVLWRYTGSSYFNGKLTEPPQPPLATFTGDSQGGPGSIVSAHGWMEFGASASGPSGDADGSGNISYAQRGGYLAPYKITGEAPSSFGGSLEIFTDSIFWYHTYTVNCASGLIWPSNDESAPTKSPYYAGHQRWADQSVTAGASTDVTPPGIFGGDLSGVSIPGKWIPDEQYEYLYLSPNFPNQPDSTLWSSIYDERSSGFLGSFPQAAYIWDVGWTDDFLGWRLDEGDYHYDNAGSVFGQWMSDLAPFPIFAYLDYFHNGGQGATILSIATFRANFGSEFSFLNKERLERFPKLVPEANFVDGELKIRLAKLPENECELVWRFPRSLKGVGRSGNSALNGFGAGALSAHNVLKVEGSGTWDAVYSGKPGDREPERPWVGTADNPNARWKNFGSYVADYWQPVLKQVVCATCGIDIQQDQTVSSRYLIKFYRADQVTKDTQTGRYTFGGDPVETFTVENPGTDADAGRMKITISNGTTYDLTLTQDMDANNLVSESTWAFKGTQNGHEFLDKEAVVTPGEVIRSDNSLQLTMPYTVVDQTKIDGISLPKITTTCWIWPNMYNDSSYRGRLDLRWIDKIVEEGGGTTRTTAFDYDLMDENPQTNSNDKYRVISHLTKITQTGGSNPYTATYDDAGQLTSYQDTWGSEDVSYSGNTVTRTQKINGQPLRTLVTTYSGDMTKATTTAK